MKPSPTSLLNRVKYAAQSPSLQCSHSPSNYYLARKETVGYKSIDPICRVMKVKIPIC